jgi:hypothetical protein
MPEDVVTLAAHARIIGEFLEGDALDVLEVELAEELLPRTVTQGSGGDEQDALAAVVDPLADQFSGEVGLAEADAISYEDAVVATEVFHRPVESILLEAGEVETGRRLIAS